MSQNESDVIGTIIFVCGAFGALGVFILVLLFSYQKKYIKHLKKEESLKLENERNLLNAQIEVKEQTLKDTGADLHDNVGQILSLVKLQLANQNDERTKYSRELLQGAINEVRELSHRLNLDWAKEVSLKELIELELKKLLKTDLFKLDVSLVENEFEIKNDYKILIIRCIQECIQNILKHAKATTIQFHMTSSPQLLEIIISDNGVGFDTNETTPSAGLNNMSNRMKTIGGSFEVYSAVGSGTSCKYLILNTITDKI
ncbi:MAG: ATP-binding protein [Pelobium sp.]